MLTNFQLSLKRMQLNHTERENIMADTNPTPPNPDTKKKQTHSGLNQAQTAALTKAEQLCMSAAKDAYAAKLAAREISAEYVATLDSDIQACRKKAASALQSTTGKSVATGAEVNATEALMVALQEVQCAAKQKFSRSNPIKLKDYGIGERIDANRPALEQWSNNIIEALAGDPLPGITAAKIAALTPLRTAYIATNSAQGGEQTQATGKRSEVETMLDSITDRRIGLQYAASAEWPHTNPANAAIRKEFYLPTDTAFNG
jgi:hypothetical protein